MSLPRKLKVVLPAALPKLLEPTLFAFCARVLSALEVYEGVNTSHKMEKMVTRRDLELLGIDTSLLDQEQ